MIHTNDFYAYSMRRKTTDSMYNMSFPFIGTFFDNQQLLDAEDKLNSPDATYTFVRLSDDPISIVSDPMEAIVLLKARALAAEKAICEKTHTF